MGMKVHSESYLSELFLMRNYPEDSNVSSWRLLYEDSFPKIGRCNNGNMQMPSMGSVGFGTETLRQTMLRQEHIFRKQVFELHRVYRVQRNLMNEIQKEGYKYQYQALAVSPHMPSFSSPVKLRPTSTITSSLGGLSTSPCANSQTLIYTHGDSKVKGSLDGDLNAKDVLSNELKRFPKRSFDLQLPAEEYVDDEDRAEISGDVSPESKTKQLSSIGGSSSNLIPETKLTPKAQNKQLPRAQFVADLNVPVQESEFTGMDDSVSARSCKPTPSYRDTKEEQLSVSLGLPKDVFQGISMYMDHHKKVKLAHLEDDGKRVKWLSHYTEPDENSNASSLTSRKKLETSSTNSRITAQTLPCFNNFYAASALKDIKDRSETWNFSSSERLATCVENDASSPYNLRHSTSFDHGGSRPGLSSACGIKNSDSSSNVASVRLDGNVHKKLVKVTDYKDANPSKGLNLNFPLYNGPCNGSVDGNVTARSLQNGPNWLRKKTDYPPFERGVSSVNTAIISPPVSSSPCTHQVDIQRAKENDASCPKKNTVLSDNFKDNFSHTNSLARLSKQNINVGGNKSSSFNKLPHQLAWADSKDQLFEDNRNLCSVKGIGFDLNLSTSATTCREDASSKGSMDVSEATKIDALVKTKVPIDLESPAPEDVGTSWVEERMMADKSLSSFEHSEIRGIETTLVKSAAEAIVAMSTIFQERVDGKKNKLEERSSSVCTSVLSWFTDIVCNNAVDNEGGMDKEKVKARVDNQQLDEEDSDYFEEMTLRLGEVDVSEYCKTTWKNKSTEEIGSPSLLTRPQKGKSRRGRQRRDFQKDILPGIATLSWHEVTEDLQTIGGLLRASSSCWPIGVGRRKARNGLNCSTRGRRRRDSLAANTPDQHGISEEIELGGVCLQGWGKTTRRARRQRYPTVNGNRLLT